MKRLPLSTLLRGLNLAALVVLLVSWDWVAAADKPPQEVQVSAKKMVPSNPVCLHQKVTWTLNAMVEPPAFTTTEAKYTFQKWQWKFEQMVGKGQKPDATGGFPDTTTAGTVKGKTVSGRNTLTLGFTTPGHKTILVTVIAVYQPDNPNAKTIEVEGTLVLQVDMIELQFVRDDGKTPTGEFVPLYRPLPAIRLQDLKGPISGNILAIKNAGTVYDPITYASKISRTWVGLTVDRVPDVARFKILTLHDDTAPAMKGGPFVSKFDIDETGLDSLRAQPLGTRWRFVYEVVNVIGRRAYEELVLEVRLNNAGQHEIWPINLAPAPADPVDATVPDRAKIAIQLTPANPAADIHLSKPLYSPATGSLSKGVTDLAPKQAAEPFVALGVPANFQLVRAEDAARAKLQEKNFYPHVRLNFSKEPESNQLRASFRPAGKKEDICPKVIQAVQINLDAYLNDEDTKLSDPVTVRLQSFGIEAAARKFYMRPLFVNAFPKKFAGTLELAYETGTPAKLEIVDPATGKPAVLAPMDAAALPPTNPRKQYLMNGLAEDSRVVLRLTWKYRGAVLLEDRVQLHVRFLPGLGGESLLGKFPFFNYVHTFHPNNPEHVADQVGVALNPAHWPHLTGWKTFQPARVKAHFVKHRTDADYAKNPSYTPALTVPNFAFTGTSIARIRKTGQLPIGDYDVILDLGNGQSNRPDTTLQPGDLIGRLSAATAEVNVVEDPLKLAPKFPSFGFIDYGSAPGAAGDTFTIPAGQDGNAAAVTDNYIHGRIYYPSNAATSGMGVACAGGTFPLVVILHGNHTPRRLLDALVAAGMLTAVDANRVTSAPNYLGYEYLQKRLAQMGYISASVDLDRYNLSAPPPPQVLSPPYDAFAWPGIGSPARFGIRARAWCAAYNVDRVRRLNAAGSGSVISGHVAFTNLTLLGHSRGGEAVVELSRYRDNGNGPFATGFLTSFDISRVASVSPTSFFTDSVGNRPYLVFHGAADGDVWPAYGFKLYDVAPGPKALMFAYGVNHNQFNTSWAYNDSVSVQIGLMVQFRRGRTVPGGPIPTYGVGANTVGTLYMQDLLTGYTLAWLKQGAYNEYFSRPANRIRPPSLDATVGVTLRPNPIHNQYRLPGQKVLDNFEIAPPFTLSSSGGTVSGFNLSVPANPATATDVSLFTVFAPPPFRIPTNGYYQATHAVELAWPGSAAGKAYYRQETDLTKRDVGGKQWFSFRAGPHYQQTVQQKMTWELRSGDHFTFVDTTALSSIGIPYKAQINFDQAILINPNSGILFNITKCMFKTYRFNFAAIQADGRDIDLRAIGSARWIFDLTPNGRIVIDDIEYSD